MKFVEQWEGGGIRKRAAEESSEESSRKRTKDDNDDDNNGRGKSLGNTVAAVIATGSRGGQEYKIRGTSNNNKDVAPSVSPSQTQSALFSVATEALPSSSSSPSVHPDRRANIIHSAPAIAPASAAMQNKSGSPLSRSSVSQSPEHVNIMETEVQRRKQPFLFAEVSYLRRSARCTLHLLARTMALRGYPLSLLFHLLY